MRYTGEEINLHSLLSSALYGGECSHSLPSRLTTKKESPRHALNRTLVGPQSPYRSSGQDTISWPARNRSTSSGRPVKPNSHLACRALPYRVGKGLDCVFPTWTSQCDRVCFTHTTLCPCRAPTMPASNFSRPRHSTAEARHGMCMNYHGRPAQVRFLPTTKRSFTIGSSDFSGYMRTFAKDTALSADGRGTAWDVWISLYNAE